VATFARVERSTRRVYQNLPAQSEVEIGCEKKTAGFPPEPCGFDFPNYFCLVFNDHVIDYARLTRACVINAHTLTRFDR